MSVCFDDWSPRSSNFPGLSCRTLDFSLAFSSIFLAILPYCCFLLLSALRLYTVIKEDIKLESKTLLASALCWGKLCCSALLILGSAIATAGSIGDDISALGVAAFALAIPTAMMVLLLSATEHKRSLASSQLLSLFLLCSIIFDAARFRSFVLVGFVQPKPLLVAGFIVNLIARVTLLALENIRKTFCLRADLKRVAYAPQTLAPPISRWLLLWFWPLLRKGSKASLRMQDLGHIEHDSAHYYARFEQAWNLHKNASYPLLRSLQVAFGKEITTPLLPTLLWACLLSVSPLNLATILDFLNSWKTNDPQPVEYGWAMVAAYGLVYVCIPIVLSQMSISAYRTMAVIRQALVEAVYRKAMTIHLDKAHEVGPGALSSYISVDMARISECAVLPYQILGLFVILAFGIAIIESQIGLSFLAFAITITVFLVGIPIISTRFVADQDKWSKATDDRVRYLSSVIESMKAIKSAAYESSIYRKYTVLRTDELKEQKAYRLRSVAVTIASYILFMGVRVISLGTFALVCKTSQERVFAYKPAFVLFSVMEVWYGVAITLVFEIPYLLSAWSSICRVETFLLKEDRNVPLLAHSEAALDFSNDASTEEKMDQVVAPRIAADNAAIGSKYCQQPYVKNLRFTCSPGSLTMIVGQVASGKSSLLLGLLGEYDITSGSIEISPKPQVIGYASQDAYLQTSLSIKDNILFDASFDSVRYQQTISACALDEDLVAMTEKDSTSASSLSGGQRARVALARCIYAQTDLLLLDDVFSALDNKTEDRVFNNLFDQHNGVLRHKTVVLVTTAVKRFKYEDNIVFLKNGAQAKTGSYETLSRDDDFRTCMAAPEDQLTSSDIYKPEQQSTALFPLSEKPSDAAADSSQDQINAEARLAAGHPVLPAIWSFVRLSGCGWMTLAVVSVFISNGIVVGGAPIYLRGWTSDSSNEKDQEAWSWIGGLLGLYCVSLLCFIVSAYLRWAFLSIKTSRIFHDRATVSLFNLSPRFFDRFKPAFALNRFSSDSSQYDSLFSITVLHLANQFGFLIPQSIVMAIASPYTLLVIAFALMLGEVGRRFYIKTSTALRGLETAAKTPLYTASDEALRGLVHLRAFGQGQRRAARITKIVTEAIQPFLTLEVARHWFLLAIGLCVSPLSVIMLSVAIINRTDRNPALAIGLIPLLHLPAVMQFTFLAITNTEISSVSVHRINTITDQPREEPENDMTEAQSTQEWLHSPSIDFKNVSLRYESSANLALNNLSLSVRPGERIGIAGRTGSGKSTLLNALFRMADIEMGSIVISGVDVTTLPRQALRSSMSFIMQEPMLLHASLRENVDPEGSYSDVDIWSALDTAQCKAFVELLPGRLDHEVAAGGSAISKGTRQLLALARALCGLKCAETSITDVMIVRKRKIMVLDEASASLDTATDLAIQNVLRTAFKGVTMIVLAHRISTISDMDRIVLMDQGRIAEEGTSEELLHMDGLYAALARMEQT